MDDLGWTWDTSDPHINTNGGGASLRWIKQAGGDTSGPASVWAQGSFLSSLIAT
jgi:hypothetical protein